MIMLLQLPQMLVIYINDEIITEYLIEQHQPYLKRKLMQVDIDLPNPIHHLQ